MERSQTDAMFTEERLTDKQRLKLVQGLLAAGSNSCWQVTKQKRDIYDHYYELTCDDGDGDYFEFWITEKGKYRYIKHELDWIIQGWSLSAMMDRVLIQEYRNVVSQFTELLDEVSKED